MGDDRQPSTAARRGIALYRAGKDELAVAALRRAVPAEPGDTTARAYLAAGLWRSGRRRQAVGVLRDRVLADADDPDAWLLLAAALWQEGQWQPALFAVDEALALDPGCEPARRLLHRIESLPERRRAVEQAGPGGAAGGAALESIVRHADPQGLRFLLALESPPTGLNGLLRSLGVAALGCLRRALPPPPGQVRSVLAAVGRLSPALASEAVAEMLAAGSPATRAAVADVVLGLCARVPQLEGPLRRLLADPAEEVRAVLADGLEPVLAAGGREADDPLVTDLLAAGDHPARPVALGWLARGGWLTGGDGERLLEQWLAEPAEDLREAALAAVVATGEEETLRRVYAAGEPAVRKAALRGFRLLGTADLLALGLWEDEPALRAEAARQLGELGAADGLAPLRERLMVETSPAVRAALTGAVEAFETRVEPAEDQSCETEE